MKKRRTYSRIGILHRRVEVVREGAKIKKNTVVGGVWGTRKVFRYLERDLGGEKVYKGRPREKGVTTIKGREKVHPASGGANIGVDGGRGSK